MKRNHRTLRAIAYLLLIAMLTLPLLTSCVIYERTISRTEINELGELVIHYSDGSSENLGVVKGADGQEGAPGIPGEDGAQGAGGEDGAKGDPGEPGENGQDGQDGVITIVPESESIALASAKGLRSAVSIYCASSATSSSYSSAGSGVIWKLDRNTGDALIITNHHVVYSRYSTNANKISENIKVYLYGAEYAAYGIEAEYVGGSMYYDIAVLSVTGSELLRNSDAAAVTVSDSEKLGVGAQAIAVGNPAAMGLSASLGIVSVDSEQIEMTAVDGRTQIKLRVMRIDTAVNSGNSGGGLYNSAGELVGIVNAKISSSSIENIAYAIPSNLAIAVAQNIVDHCLGTATQTLMRATLGITVGVLDSHGAYDATTGQIKTVEKVAIQKVEENSAAYGILQANDVLLSGTLGEKTVTVTRSYHALDLLLEARAGDTVTFRILRGEEEMAVSITISSENMVAY